MSRWTWLPALAISAAVLAGCGGADTEDGDRPDASTAQESSNEETTLVGLTLPPVEAGRCMPPSVENLRAQDMAFEGTVTALDEGGTATLQVSTMYAGEPFDNVRIAVPTMDLSDLILAVDLREGETYLISSLDGEVSACGLSGPKDALLDALYQEAYPG